MSTADIFGYFYPRSHVGNDLKDTEEIPVMLNFYPRSHVGNDERDIIDAVKPLDFYPRSHVGNDPAIRSLGSALSRISIHVPT